MLRPQCRSGVRDCEAGTRRSWGSREPCMLQCRPKPTVRMNPRNSALVDPHVAGHASSLDVGVGVTRGAACSMSCFLGGPCTPRARSDVLLVSLRVLGATKEDAPLPASAVDCVGYCVPWHQACQRLASGHAAAFSASCRARKAHRTRVRRPCIRGQLQSL